MNSDDREPEPSKIRNNPNNWPCFRICVGAVDGSHVYAHVEGDPSRWRNRKGYLSRNVLAVVCYTYVLPRYKGSCHDGRVLVAGYQRGFTAAEGRYYLVDAEYPLAPRTLTPYRGVRYHLREQVAYGQPPESAKELFNLCDSQLRNVVERSVEAFKGRIQVFDTEPEFSLEVQSDLVLVCTALRNVMDRLQGKETLTGKDMMAMEDETNDFGAIKVKEEAERASDALKQSKMFEMRDTMAEEM